MPNYNYIKGANFERKIRKLYEEEGWLTFRSAGSHSPADLVCIRQGGVILVQCKLNGVITKTEREYLIVQAVENRIQAVLAYKKNHKVIRERIV